jgi:hypothetical protein
MVRSFGERWECLSLLEDAHALLSSVGEVEDAHFKSHLIGTSQPKAQSPRENASQTAALLLQQAKAQVAQQLNELEESRDKMHGVAVGLLAVPSDVRQDLKFKAEQLMQVGMGRDEGKEDVNHGQYLFDYHNARSDQQPDQTVTYSASSRIDECYSAFINRQNVPKEHPLWRTYSSVDLTKVQRDLRDGIAHAATDLEAEPALFKKRLVQVSGSSFGCFQARCRGSGKHTPTINSWRKHYESDISTNRHYKSYTSTDLHYVLTVGLTFENVG